MSVSECVMTNDANNLSRCLMSPDSCSLGLGLAAAAVSCSLQLLYVFELKWQAYSSWPEEAYTWPLEGLLNMFQSMALQTLRLNDAF